MEQGLDPAECDIPSTLNFLQHLLEEDKAASTLKVYVAAISAYHFPVGGSSVGSHSLACSFLNHLNPARTPHFPVWDLSLVLAFLCTSQFEPLQSIDIKWMSLKTAFLLAIVSVKQVSELHTINSKTSLSQTWHIPSHSMVLAPKPINTVKISKLKPPTVES